jgi:large subunit ribosomal protein L3
MIQAILGRKIKQTQRFTEKGIRFPVTQIEAGPCSVVQIKSIEKDGYSAFQLGFGTKKEINTTKPSLGRNKKAGLKINPRFFVEIDFDEAGSEKPEVGAEVKVGDVFKAGDIVNILGTSKGKGFAGGVKRYHFKGGPRTHGQSDRERAPGSIGTTTTPGRVLKGKRMAGHLGSDQATVRNLEVIEVDSENNYLWIKGLVPGAANGLLKIELQNGINR